MTFELTHATELRGKKKLVWYSGVPGPFPLALFEVKGKSRSLSDCTIAGADPGEEGGPRDFQLLLSL